MLMTQVALSVNRLIFAAAVLAITCHAGAGLALSPTDALSGARIYQVVREGQVIGQLRQDFERKGERLVVVTEADITVTFLGLNIYEADQRVEEVWEGGKLISVISRADVDGDGRSVTLKRQGNRLVGIYNGKERNLSAALVPTTLWNSAIVEAKSVLDTSKAKARKINVIDRGPEDIVIMGETLPAHRYTIEGEFRREVWYGSDGVLLAVEMEGKDGSLIRQELLQSR